MPDVELVAALDGLGVPQPSLDQAAHDALDHSGLVAITTSILLRASIGGDTTYTINSSTYPSAEAWREFRLDFGTVLWDSFQIWTGWSQSNEASQSVFMRLDHNSGGLFALSGQADDLTIPDTRGHHVTGWIPITRNMTNQFATLHLSIRGSNGTVDLLHQGIGVSFRRQVS